MKLFKRPETIGRISLLFACAVLALFAARNSISNIAAKNNAALALHFGSNADALASRADQLLVDAQNENSLSTAASLARASLVKNPINPRALRVLAFANADRPGSIPAARLIGLSNRLSRRDLGTQLWLIENAVSRNRLRVALSHYDIALRGIGNSRPLLFPILRDALSEPQIRGEFASTIKSNPEWLASFLSFAIDSPAAAVSIAQSAILAGGFPKTKIFRYLETKLIGQLSSNAQYELARAFYLRLPGSSADVTTSLSLISSTIDQRFAPITWQVVNNENISTVFDQIQANGRSTMHISIGAGNRSTAAQKLQYQESGTYLVEMYSTFSDHTSDSSLTLTMSCLKKEPMRILQLTSEPDDRRAVRQLINIPSNCPTQMVAIEAYGGNGQLGTDAEVIRLAIRRATP